MVKRSCIVAAIVAVLTAVTVTSCSSSRSAAPAAGANDGETFTSAIEPLVQEKCQTCHREGGTAPFPLVTYEDVKAMGIVAKDKVARREMPPWGAFDDETCSVRHKFKGDLSLTQEQIDLFVRWVDRGMPRGAPSSHVAAQTTPMPSGLANKTNTFEVAARHEVAGGGEDELRCFPVDPGFTEDAWISESIVVPADPKVVHHALVYLDPYHEGIEKAEGADSYPCFGGPELTNPSLLLAWSPGGTPTIYGENAGLRVPKNAHLVMQVHYHPLPTRATGKLNIEVAKLAEKPKREATFVLVGNAEGASDTGITLLPDPTDRRGGPEFRIPANARDHVETMELVMPKSSRALRLSAVGAHMHWAGVGMRVEVIRPAADGDAAAKECLLSTKYDFNWQRTYTYDAPLAEVPALRGGDKLRIACTFDNSMENRHIARAMSEVRRSSPADIFLGSSSLDEMCQAILVFVD